MHQTQIDEAAERVKRLKEQALAAMPGPWPRKEKWTPRPFDILDLIEQLEAAKRAVLSEAKPAEAVPSRLLTVVRFLLGEGPLDGVWFGDEVLPRGKFWWRKELRAAVTAPRAAEAKDSELLDALKELARGYANTLANARDIMSELGHECDDLEVMEQNDPHLTAARKVIADAEAKQ